MKRKLFVLTSFVLALLFIFIIITNFSTENNRDKELKVGDYFPKEEMIKEFSGGFENSGFIHTIDRIEDGKAQIK